MSIPPFRYLRWIKERAPAARVSLASSGMDHPPESIFPIHRLAFRLDIPDTDGYEPLVERIAHHLGVTTDRVVAVPGCTYATHLATRALLPPESVALVESPTYELMVRLPELMGARVRRLPRRLDEGFQVPRSRLEEALDQPIRALLLTAPHNPSGRLLSDQEVAEIAALAEAHDFRVLADEVYLDFVPSSRRSYRSLAGVSDRFVTTGSLTKAHGLANLRVGWVAGPPDVIRTVKRLHEYLSDRIPAFDAQAAVLAFERIDALLDRAYACRARNWPVVDAWARQNPLVELVDPGAGITTLVRIPEGIDCLALAEKLFVSEGVLVVPAEMFGSVGYLRLSFGIETPMLEEGLRALDRILAQTATQVA